MKETTLLLQLPVTPESQTDDKAGRVITAAGILLYIALRLWRLTQFNLQRDEIFSLETARLGWGGMLGAITTDVVHPPLFYVLLKIWILVDDSLLWLRLLPTLIALLSLIPFLLLCRELRLPASTRNIALLLFAVNGYLIEYSSELRMYSLLVCFAVGSVWLFVNWWNKEKNTYAELLRLLVAHILLVYTHYYGWSIVGIELLFVVLWRRDRLRSFAALMSVLVLSYVPWLALVLNALEARPVALSTQLSWHYQPGIVDIAAYFARLNGSFRFPRSTLIGLLLFGGVIVWAVWDVWRRSKPNERGLRLVLGLLLTLALLPTTLAFALSRAFTESIWHARYLIGSAVPYLLLVACALSQLRARWLKLLLVGFVIVWAGVAGVMEIQRTDTRISWDVLTRQMRDSEPAVSQSIKIYALDDLPRYPMNFYLRAAGERRFQLVRATAADISQLTDARLWVIYAEGTWPFGSSPQQFVLAQGYRIGPTFTSGPRGRRQILFAATK